MSAMLKEKPKPVHYVNNKELYQKLVERKQRVLAARENNLPVPRVDDYLGKVILDICNKLSFRWNFINYTYRDEMVSDGIENCLDVVDKFDPEKSTNPFAYFTKIAFRAFVRRIQKEKKQQLIKNKLLEEIPLDEFIGLQDQDDDGGFVNSYLEFLRENNFTNTDDLEESRPKKKQKLEKFMEDGND
jgi:hypothetical protein